MLTFDELLAGQAVVVILRGQAPDRAMAMAEAVWDAGAGVVEVPIQDPAAVTALEVTAAAGRRRGHPVGAGTVLTPDQVRQAKAAGAAFTVAPGFDADVLTASMAAGLPHLPGVATPTEVQRAIAAGCRWMKAFPASVLGTAWFREMRGPFPGVSFVATGGITAGTASSYLEAGARAVGVGSAVTRPGGLEELLAALAGRRTGAVADREAGAAGGRGTGRVQHA
ncbi:MAG: bifunctional 4-hydroxy-2-oxoglutarate aldolase/2-dehydro-3-deoxy-phosphogluconate aldolase [Micromonosporaceae bacterium]